MNKICFFLILFVNLLSALCLAPSSYDWRNYGIVSLKESVSYATNWALTITSHLESLYAKNYGKQLDLSETMLLDCCINEDIFTVKLMEITFQWLKKNGILLESDYPFKGIRSTCKFDATKSVMKIIGYKKLENYYSNITCADEEEMKQFLIDNGPLIVAFNSKPLQTYSSGIIDLPESKCPKSGINHTGLLVGYGTANGIDYWIVKNTWGKVWGEAGYFRIRRGNGTCGINCQVISAKISKI